MMAAPCIAYRFAATRWRLRRCSTVVVFGAFLSASCSDSKCTPFSLYEHTLTVTAKDSVTGALVANTTLTAVTSQYGTATLSIGSDVSQYPVVFYNPASGPNTVTVAAAGYATWSQAVSVPDYSGGDCKPINVASVTALMQKSH